MIEPLRFEFEVACPLEDAFDLWTRRTSSWWPISHTVTAEPGLQVIFEGRAGGRIFERTSGGREVDWGEVTIWEPPARLCYLWHIRTDRSDATEVEIRFSPRSETATHIDIEHRGWERLGIRGANWRDANRSGWSGVLPLFVGTCARVSTGERTTA